MAVEISSQYARLPYRHYHIGIIHDIQGPSNSITCAETSAHLAIAEAAQIIARGASDIALAGGAEAKVNPIVMIRQCLLKRATDQNNDEPASACRPFDALAEVVGIGQSNNINPQYEHLEPDGKGIEIAIKKAMADAQIGPEDLDLIGSRRSGNRSNRLADQEYAKQHRRCKRSS